MVEPHVTDKERTQVDKSAKIAAGCDPNAADLNDEGIFFDLGDFTADCCYHGIFLPRSHRVT